MSSVSPKPQTSISWQFLPTSIKTARSRTYLSLTLATVQPDSKPFTCFKKMLTVSIIRATDIRSCQSAKFVANGRESAQDTKRHLRILTYLYTSFSAICCACGSLRRAAPPRCFVSRPICGKDIFFPNAKRSYLPNLKYRKQLSRMAYRVWFLLTSKTSCHIHSRSCTTHFRSSSDGLSGFSSSLRN